MVEKDKSIITEHQELKKIDVIEVVAEKKLIKNIFTEIDKRQYTPNVI